jgi:uncharacterized DUF497 family protein
MQTRGLPSFEWDGRKASQNRGKHGVSFEETCFVFADPLSLTVPDSLDQRTSGNQTRENHL